MHYEEAYRREKPFDLKACDLAVNTHTTNNTVLTCIVEIGPSVLLINYEPHILTAQLKFFKGPSGPVTRYPGFAYPTKAMTISNVRRLYNVPDNLRNNTISYDEAANALPNSLSNDKASDSVSNAVPYD